MGENIPNLRNKFKKYYFLRKISIGLFSTVFKSAQSYLIWKNANKVRDTLVSFRA